MKISEKAKRIWKYVGYAVLALIAITAIIVIWNKWFSRTRVAFINYQAYICVRNIMLDFMYMAVSLSTETSLI